MNPELDLGEGAAALGIELRADQLARLHGYADLLVRWNATTNLVSRRDEPRVLSRHVLDSLSLAPSLVMSRILDVGTGAGLPGVPLAIACPQAHFVLLDRSERRLGFVRHALAELEVSNAEVCAADVAVYEAEPLFDTVVSRAVAAPARLWPMVRRLLAAGGAALFQCGDPNTLETPAMAKVESKQLRIPGLDVPHWMMRIEAMRA